MLPAGLERLGWVALRFDGGASAPPWGSYERELRAACRAAGEHVAAARAKAIISAGADLAR